MDYTVEISDSAREELRAIFEYIVEKYGTTAGAKRAVKKIEDTIFSLQKFPKFRKYRFNSKYYVTIAGKYSIIYKVVEEVNTVVVVHIFYSRNKPKTY